MVLNLLFFFYQQVDFLKCLFLKCSQNEGQVRHQVNLVLKMTHYSCCVLCTLLVTTNLTHARVDLVIHDITRCPYSLIPKCWLINHAITAQEHPQVKDTGFLFSLEPTTYCLGRFPRISLSSVTSNRFTEQQFAFFPLLAHSNANDTHQ